jgi:aspartyl protease family protein
MGPAAAACVHTLLLALAGSAQAQSVALTGVLGSKALLVVDGGAPRAVAAGETHQGVRVVSVAGDQAVVEIAGRRQTVRMGDSPASVGGGGSPNGTRIVLTADGGGHFMGSATINGRAVQFMVDTGASVVALGINDAERIGLNFRGGQSIRTGTANGVGQAWRLRLNSIRVGDVELFDVEAVVTAQPMPFVLLGNSFLNRFQMRRENDQMTLDRRY